MKKILKKIYNGKYLNELESYTLFYNIFHKNINDMQTSSILSILSYRKETYEEIVGARKFLMQSVKLFPKPSYVVSDIVGTGGDQKNSFNISTVSALVSACYGIKIAKICNINSSGNFGSANLLQKLNINIKLSPEKSRKCLDNENICFLLANSYFNDFEKISNIRKSLCTRTIFNILGPLLNPAQPKYALIGVYKKELMSLYAKILSNLQYKRAIIVHSGGTDEATLYSKTHIVELNNKKIIKYKMYPRDFGLEKCDKKYLINKTEQENYIETVKLLQGKGNPVYAQTIAINVALLMKTLGNDNISQNTLKIFNFINTGQVYDFVTKLSTL